MTSARLVTGLLLIAVPIVFMLAFTGLQMTFDYPDVLRWPASDVLTRFSRGGDQLHLLWYAMMAAAVGLISATIGTGLLLRARGEFLAALSVGFGVLAGLVQVLGLSRWVFLVPGLAANFVRPEGSETDKAIAASLFDAANRYLGVGIGEHLGYLFTALWTLTIAMLLWRAWKWLAVAAIPLALGVAAGMLEPFGVPMAADINAISFSLWALWMIVFGVLVIWRWKKALAAA
jgi:hypothetical protein